VKVTRTGVPAKLAELSLDLHHVLMPGEAVGLVFSYRSG
jgi:hypothetical protein